MSPQEQAKIGLRLLMDAIVEYLRAYPEGRTTQQARDDLGLHSPDGRGQWGDNLFWGLHNRLEAEGSIRLDRTTRPSVMFLATATTENAEPTPASAAVAE
jgi:hypothetical protein